MKKRTMNINFLFFLLLIPLYSCFLIPLSEIEYLILNLEETKITSYDGTSFTYFGNSLSCSDDGKTFIAGASGSEFFNKPGSVYIFTKNSTSWDQYKIIASDSNVFSAYGSVVSISADGNRCIVSAPYDNVNGTISGSLYVYQLDGTSWEETKILPSDGSPYAAFGAGADISADGNTLIVGASASAYSYKWNGLSWDETKIIPVNLNSSEFFGESVAISANGNRIVAGAYHNSLYNDTEGCFYVFTWNGTTWDQMKINSSDNSSNHLFGICVSISGDGNTIIIGSPAKSYHSSYSGSVYIYEWNGSSWEENKIISPEGENAQLFGMSVSISPDGKTFLTGGFGFSGSGICYVYLYKKNGASWDGANMISSYDHCYDNFGKALSLSWDGNTFIIGANKDSENGENSGAVYLYR